MGRYLRLIGLFTKISFQEMAAYRTDFFVQFFVTLMHFVAELVGIWTIFHNTTSVAGWNVYEMVALLGVFRTMSAVIGLFIAPNMRQVMEDIRDGRLDFIVLKPVNAQFFVSFRRVVVWRVAEMLIGLGLVAVACSQLQTSLGAVQVLMFVVMLAAGTVIIYAFWLILATCAFWFTRINNIEMVFWNVFEAGRYPIDIYRWSIRMGLTYVVPLAFITTFPARALVGKAEPVGMLFALVMAGVSLALASAFWRYGLRYYSGASA